MCVAITLMPGAQLTLEELIKMDRANADGVGLAWVDTDGVHWWKTIKVNPEEVKENLILTVESPRLLHFRLATAGGTKDELCHPFDISEWSICTPQGMGTKVMIHNGHWGRWQEVAKLLDDEDMLPDKGPWSDSRLAAYLSHVNPDWLLALGGRVATLDAKGKVERLGDWQELREGIHVSNKYWETATHRRGGYEGFRTWRGWSPEDFGFDSVTPPAGTACLTTDIPSKEDRKRAKKEKAKAASNEAAEILAKHPNAWWNAGKGCWSYWDAKAHTVVELAPSSTKGQGCQAGALDASEAQARASQAGQGSPVRPALEHPNRVVASQDGKGDGGGKC